MGEVPLIAGVYKMLERIGSGGGGTVYLAEHSRLDKKVVLKATKGNLSKKPEKLRREVDALKDLSHTYIPQVYDLVEEDGTVYTVMDYIDGESLDVPLSRNERFNQIQVIEWATQLLEAIDYLHSRPPYGILHADIKPSNVMLTPQGDVRLIDFNIALALGEEGAIAVGRSFGYASPESYGRGLVSDGTTRNTSQKDRTELSEDDVSETILETEPSSSSATTGKKTKILDARSDIYSLGATLYHLIAGERPDKDASKVKPITTKDFSPGIIEIVEKAMDPNPDLRWQSAKDMLYAFKSLRENDPQAKKYKRAAKLTATLLATVFLAGGMSVFAGQRLMEQQQRQIAQEQSRLAEEQSRLAEEQSRLAEEQSRVAEEQRLLAQLNEAYVMAEYSANAYRNGDAETAVDYALQALDLYTPPIAEGQKALTDALKVYDLSDGFKIHKTVELPSAPLFMEISPDGKTAAAVYAYEIGIFDTDTAEILVTLPTEPSALAEVKFLDNSTIIFSGAGGITAYNIEQKKELWTGEPATAICISADGTKAAGVYKDEGFATVYDIGEGRVLHNVDFSGKYQRVAVNDAFANPNNNILSLNHDGTLLGVSFADGSLWIYDLANAEGDIQLFDETSGYTRFEGGFHNQYFAFSAADPTSAVFAVIDTVEMVQTGGFDSTSPFGVLADETGVYVQTENLLVNIHPVTGEQIPLVKIFENINHFARSEGHTLITSKDEFMFFDENANLIGRHEKEYGSDFIEIAEGTALIGSLDAPVIRIMKYESHPDTEVFAYDPSYIHDEARLSADGETVMLFSYEAFRLYNVNGEMIAEVEMPEARNIYDQQYTRDDTGSYLKVIYNDGTIRSFSAKDGSLIDETVGEKPDLSLYEEFFTDKLRIESPLHGAPLAYDIETNTLLSELEKDDYLTYVTQAGDYIITQYVTTDNSVYGLLLNDECETLAYLPYLCDIIGDRLIFNYPTGNLRETRIYAIDELIEVARSK